MTRKLLAALLLALASVAVGVGTASARATDPGAVEVPVVGADGSAPRATSSTTSPAETTESLPGTTLEAEQRDDGTTSAAPWLIGSGIAAAVVVGLGGLFLKSRTEH